MSSAIDPMELRRCLGAFVTGVTVITTLDEHGVLQGMTVNSFNSVSLDPPLIVWSLRTNSASFNAYSKEPRFVVNILAQDQINVSNLFAKSSSNRFDSVQWSAGIGGVPMIEGCAAHIECRLEAIYPGGDHVLVLGRVERIVTSTRTPLAFRLGKYMVVHPHDQKADRSGNVAAFSAVHAARTVLDEVGRQTDMTVGLGVWGNLGPTLIWFNESSKPLNLKLHCGVVVPLLSSATGKIFAAFSPRSLIEPYIAEELAAGRKFSEGFTLPEELDRILAEIRGNRLASVRGSFLEGVCERPVNAVSTPVFDAGGEIVLALTMMSHDDEFGEEHPAVRVLESRAECLSEKLRDAGR